MSWAWKPQTEQSLKCPFDSVLFLYPRAKMQIQHFQLERGTRVGKSRVVGSDMRGDHEKDKSSLQVKGTKGN